MLGSKIRVLFAGRASIPHAALKSRILPSTASHHKKLTAAFSTHSGGLRKVVWGGTWLNGVHGTDARTAQLAYDKSNPFDDPTSKRCIIIFDLSSKHDLDKHPDLFVFEANLVSSELNKVVKAAGKGKTAEWPVIWSLDFCIHSRQGVNLLAPEIRIMFQLPSSKSLLDFEKELEEVGLRGGDFGGPLDDNAFYWARVLYCMPEEDKEW